MRPGTLRGLAAPSGHALVRLGGNASPAHLARPRAGVCNLLVLSVSAGAGHVRAAEAICGHASARNMEISTRHIDAMDFSSPALRKIYTGFYLSLVRRFPALWSQIYHRTDRGDPNGLFERLRSAIERASMARLLDEIDTVKPDAIVCTHFLPAGMLARLRRNGRLRCPVWVQVTDFDLHRIWVHVGVTGYFAGNEEVAYRLRDKGVPAHAIRVTGIPIMPEFDRVPDRAGCARQLGIDPGRTTLLLMGGGAGLGRLDQVAERLMMLDMDFQLIVMAGANIAALARLKALEKRFPGRLVALGFTPRVAEAMACSDLAITKPGGLTVSECLAMGLPMIVNQPIPGQEERNADYLLEQGVGLKAYDAATLEYRIVDLLGTPGKLAAMRSRAVGLGMADAGRAVIDTVLGFHA